MGAMPSEAKEALRRRVLGARRAAPEAARRQWSLAICRHVCGSDAFGSAARLVSYLPIGAEVDPSAAAEAAFRAGLPVYYPVDGPDPSVRRARRPLADPEVADGEPLAFDARGVLFLVPGVAFDSRGGRLGRGRGWYDRLLPRYPEAARWGLAFALQVVPRLPVDAWDVPMDVVATERGYLPSAPSFSLPEGIS
jgi:5-formyltetrahydrofolate cyclo-ligase